MLIFLVSNGCLYILNIESMDVGMGSYILNNIMCFVFYLLKCFIIIWLTDFCCHVANVSLLFLLIINKLELIVG